jgi:NAD(P)-dependent dehydrogenase (short-subunit alcohol dehydrogenase family)
MTGLFDNKVVLITGATSGIGKATLKSFTQENAKIIAASKDEIRGKQLMKHFKEYSTESQWFKVDITDNNSVKNLFKEIINSYDKLDIGFNNASTGGEAGIIHEINIDDWDHTINGTLTSVFRLMKFELEIMSKQKAGAIINNASVDGLRGFSLDPAYSASKHGVIGLTKSAAIQYASQGIRINVICPGWTDTPPVRQMLKENVITPIEIDFHQPIKRLAKPEEIAELVIWLASEKASFVTGAIIPIDGGYSAV